MNEEINEGDLVVCVDDTNLPDDYPKIKRGSKYVIDKIAYCTNCGHRAVSIGIPRTPLTRAVNKCCGAIVTSFDFFVFKIERFRKIPPPAKEIRVVSIASDLREEVRELVNDVLVKERRDV